MLDTYRKKGEAANPEVFVAAIAATLCLYPPEVVQRVTDPRTGIASRLKWIPEVAEIREACEAEMVPIRRQKEREAEEAQRQQRRRELDEERRRADANPAKNSVSQYLSDRKVERAKGIGAPAAAETILRVYLEGRARYGNKVTLSPDARAIIEAAGLEIPG
jgi:hypothetical protein